MTKIGLLMDNRISYQFGSFLAKLNKKIQLKLPFK